MPNEEIEKLTAEKAANENEIRQLKNRQKILLNRQTDAERKERNHRLIVRGATLESIAPEVKHMTEAEVTELLTAAMSCPEARRTLDLKRRDEDAQNP